MEETPKSENFEDNELKHCFIELKKLSMIYNLKQSQSEVPSGVNLEPENPLEKQFTLILGKIDDNLDKYSKISEEYLKTLCMKTSILYEKAKLLLAENHLEESKILFEQAMNFLLEFSEDPKVSFLYLRIVNHLTYVLSRMGEYETAKDLLLKVVAAEKQYKPEVFSTDDLFLPPLSAKNEKVLNSKLNRLFINNMQMLSWVYGKIGNSEQHLKIQHDILQKHLELKELSPIMWADSCLRLSGIFLVAEDFINARYHLAAAECVLSPLEYSCGGNPDLNSVQGELARSWIFYCLQLFDCSIKEKIRFLEGEINLQENESELEHGVEKETAAQEPKNVTDSQKPCLEFENLEVDVYEKKIPCEKIRDLDQAENLFNCGQRWIKRARLHYTLKDFPSQYVNLSLDLSDLYRFLASYEPNLEAEYLIQKKRYDSLETMAAILKEARPACYVAVTVELTKEIIEAQLDMMNLNLKKLYSPSEGNKRNYINHEDHLRRKMNALATLHTQLDKVSLNVESNPFLSQKREEAEILP